MPKVRLDTLIFERGLTESRERAKALIMEGSVYVNGMKAEKAGMQVKEDASIEIRDPSCPYVSRGGLKLHKALEVFDIDPSGMVGLDIGSSTGGFTDCLLKHGAKRVYAVDVGTNQLAYRLRTDGRVKVFEKTNFRYFERENVPDRIDIAVMDVSFISITKLAENIRNFCERDTEMVFLIKPQFESDRRTVGKGEGVITDPKDHVRIVTDVTDKMEEQGFFVRDMDYSPVKGQAGNIEFITRFTLDPSLKTEDPAALIEGCVKRAHSQL